MTLYFAYGSNLDLSQMARRCPAATPLGKFYLPDTRLVFRRVCDVIAEDGATCPGGLWRLTPKCEQALDRYEGFDPRYPDSGMYSKEYIQVAGLPDGETEVMIYTMNSSGIYPPSVGYFKGVRQGYKDFGLKLWPLKEALKHAHDAKAPSHVERKRIRRTGRQPSAADPRKVKQEPTAVLPAAQRAWVPVSPDRAAARAKIRAAAREADRASAELKKRVRPVVGNYKTSLAAWLEHQQETGGSY